MIMLIQLFGVIIFLAGLVLLAKPSVIVGFLQANSSKFFVHFFAVIVRLLIGILFISQAPDSTFPVAITALGWIFIIAAICLTAIGRAKFTQLINWVLVKFGRFSPVSGVMALMFGGFMVYAFL